jgi:phage gp36-like protein
VFSDDEDVPNPKTNTAADLPKAQLTEAINEASSIVDSAIGGRYVTPVADVDGATPHPIDFWTRAIAAYLATCTYRKSQDFSNDDPVYRRYLVATQRLIDIQNGKGSLPLPVNTGDYAAAGAGQPANLYSGNLFSADDFNLTPDYPNQLYNPNRPDWWGL